YARRADADRSGGRERDRRSGGRRTRSPTGDVRLPARWPAGTGHRAECPGEPLRPAVAERCLARSAGATAWQAHHDWRQLQRACRGCWEGGGGPPPPPPLNFRLVTCINAPYGDMWLPSKSEQFDYELEFTAVIGRRCRGITRAQVSLVVVGYTIFNDGSVRDYQRHIHNNLGKSWDTHGPL